MLRKAITIALVVAVVGIAANDFVRYLKGHQELGSTTFDLTQWAAQNAKIMTRDQAAMQLATMGTTAGVTVYQYGQDDIDVKVWTSKELTGTVVAHTLVNLTQGMGFSKARKTPLKIKTYREARVQ